jgi:hypothetical protein
VAGADEYLSGRWRGYDALSGRRIGYEPRRLDKLLKVIDQVCFAASLKPQRYLHVGSDEEEENNRGQNHHELLILQTASDKLKDDEARVDGGVSHRKYHQSSMQAQSSINASAG